MKPLQGHSPRRFAPLAVLASLLTSACALSPTAPSTVPLAPAVDLDRFAGDWYVIAHIPTDSDAGSHNALEHYRVLDAKHIAVTYRNRLGGFDGQSKTITPSAVVIGDSNNALWGVRFGWYLPFLFEYRIAHLEPDYSAVIVARSKLDYAWVMSRQPSMSEVQLARYTGLLKAWGYDTSRLQRVPQQWPNPVDGSMPPLGPLSQADKR